MARFDPPLTRPGNHKCPNCGKTLSWIFLLDKVQGYSCYDCQYPFKFDGWRTILGLVALVPGFVVWGLIMNFAGPTVSSWPTGWPVFAVAWSLGGVAMVAFNIWWFSSIKNKSITEETRQGTEVNPKG